MVKAKRLKLINILLITATIFATQTVSSQELASGATNLKSTNSAECQDIEAHCAKTITMASAPNGKWWRVWSINNRVYYNTSTNSGHSFSEATMIKNINEPISSRGENRIKVGFDGKNGVYLSWASPKQKRFTADVRFSFSSDNGKNFSKPITINDDNLLAGHSFNEMMVNSEGKVSLVWLDGRKKVLAKQAGQTKNLPNGSSLYFASATPRKGDLSFLNRELAGNTCQCCRLSLSKNTKGQAAIFWRQIYAKNTREFALLTDNKEKQIHQISFDKWQINGCPHQGGALGIDSNNRYHMVWFNQGKKGKGIFYAYSDNEGKTLGPTVKIGLNEKKSAHPHLLQTDNRIDIVWLQLDQQKHQLWHQKSLDSGVNFMPAKMIAESEFSPDRPFLVGDGEQVFVSWLSPKSNHLFQAL